LKAAGLATAEVSFETQVREFIESVEYPGEENVVRGSFLERVGKIGISVDELPDARCKFNLGTVFRRRRRKLHYAVREKTVVRRVWSNQSQLRDIERLSGLDGITVKTDESHDSIATRHQRLNDASVVEYCRHDRSRPLLLLL
jgi:hypothetical protein